VAGMVKNFSPAIQRSGNRKRLTASVKRRHYTDASPHHRARKSLQLPRNRLVEWLFGAEEAGTPGLMASPKHFIYG
jgi:hypothetical protein